MSYNEEELDIVEYCAPIRSALQEFSGVEVWAEPGRFISSKS